MTGRKSLRKLEKKAQSDLNSKKQWTLAYYKTYYPLTVNNRIVTGHTTVLLAPFCSDPLECITIIIIFIFRSSVCSGVLLSFFGKLLICHPHTLAWHFAFQNYEILPISRWGSSFIKFMSASWSITQIQTNPNKLLFPQHFYSLKVRCNMISVANWQFRHSPDGELAILYLEV